ncbi:unnamed protein product, partial [Polarella glacialis]
SFLRATSQTKALEDIWTKLGIKSEKKAAQIEEDCPQTARDDGLVPKTPTFLAHPAQLQPPQVLQMQMVQHAGKPDEQTERVGDQHQGKENQDSNTPPVEQVLSAPGDLESLEGVDYFSAGRDALEAAGIGEDDPFLPESAYH